MQKQTVLPTLLLGIKYGVVAILLTALFLPLPIIVGDYFGRINTVGHYSGPLPASWICGFSLGTLIPFSLPFVLSGCVLNSIIVFYNKTSSLKEDWGKLSGRFLE